MENVYFLNLTYVNKIKLSTTAHRSEATEGQKNTNKKGRMVKDRRRRQKEKKRRKCKGRIKKKGGLKDNESSDYRKTVPSLSN